MCCRSALNFVEFQHKVSNVIGNRRIENRMRCICRDTWRWRPRHRISLPPSVRSQWIATIPRNARRRGRRRYGGAFVAMAPSPSYQPVATGPVATSCDLPAQCATTRASSLRGLSWRCATTRASSLRNSTNGQMQSQIVNRKIVNPTTHYQLPTTFLRKAFGQSGRF